MYELVAYRIPKGCSYSEYAKDLVRDIKNGKNIEDAKDKLFRMSYPIVAPELKKFASMGDPEDFTGDMSIAFMNTIKNFDPDKEGASFINYYKRAIKNEIINSYFGKYKNKKEWMDEYNYHKQGIRSLHEPLFDKNDKETGFLGDIIVDESIDFDENINYISLTNSIYKGIDEIFKKNKKLKNRGKDMFTYYIDNCVKKGEITQLEVGAKFNASRGNVSNIMALYKPKLKEILQREGYID